VRTLHGVGHVTMLDDPAGVAALIRDFATRAAASDHLPPRARHPEHPDAGVNRACSEVNGH
jgi:hypothetical protein